MEKDKIPDSVLLRLVVIFCLVTIGFISLGIFYYRYEARHIMNDKYDEISAIARLKVDSIQDWRKHRLADVQRVSAGPLVRKEIARLIHVPKDNSARKALQLQLHINRKGNIYANALFLDTKGNILISDNPDPAPVDQATMKAIESALKDRKETLSNFFREPEGLIFIDAVAPIPDDRGNSIAIMVLRSNAADFLYPLIQTWPTPSRTAETILIRRDGDSILFLNELRHKTDTALNLRFPVATSTLPAAQAVSGKYGRFLGRDYRGAEVLAMLLPVPESPWFVVAKIDTEEILTEVKYRAWVITIIITLLILISAGLIMMIYQNRQKTERKLAEEELLRSKAFSDSIIEHSPHAMWISDDKGTLIRLNEACCNLLHIKNDEVLGKYNIFKDSIVINQGHLPLVRKVFEQGETVRFTIVYDSSQLKTLELKEHVFLILDTTISPFLDSMGHVIHAIVQHVDITERKLAEEHLAATMADLERSNKDLEQFAYVASHDLQEPLRMVSSYTQLLAERYQGQLDEKALKFINYAVDGATRMQALINDLLIYSRVGTRGKSMELTDAHDLLGQAIKNLIVMIEENRAVITNDELPVVRVDTGQFIQVFQNLINNSIKFRGDDIPLIRVSARDWGQEWVFSVRDNGIGIDQKYADRIFVIFQRLHGRQEYPGNGIGLAMCKKIVERHNGRIWFESEPGKGATFLFTIPKEAGLNVSRKVSGTN
jgi:PAS domain S-box-containing protein